MLGQLCQHQRLAKKQQSSVDCSWNHTHNIGWWVRLVSCELLRIFRLSMCGFTVTLSLSFCYYSPLSQLLSTHSLQSQLPSQSQPQPQLPFHLQPQLPSNPQPAASNLLLWCQYIPVTVSAWDPNYKRTAVGSEILSVFIGPQARIKLPFYT